MFCLLQRFSGNKSSNNFLMMMMIRVRNQCVTTLLAYTKQLATSSLERHDYGLFIRQGDHYLSPNWVDWQAEQSVQCRMVAAHQAQSWPVHPAKQYSQAPSTAEVSLCWGVPNTGEACLPPLATTLFANICKVPPRCWRSMKFGKVKGESGAGYT